MTLGCKQSTADGFLVTWHRYLKQSRLLKLGHTAVHNWTMKSICGTKYFAHLKSPLYQS